MQNNLAELLNRNLNIGQKTIANRLVMAPMSYLGHVAFRELLAHFGGYGLLFTEMCSAKRIPTENPQTSAFFRWRETELPRLVCQIVGNDPDKMVVAAKRIQAEGFFGVDINFGCATGTICSHSGGAAVLKNPALAHQIVASVREAVTLPLFVKFRTGWQDDPQHAAMLAQRFETAGADALTFHPRVAPDRRLRPAKWPYIKMVKEAVNIPVFGNGDVFTGNDCLRMLQTTGCDGVAIGRLGIAQPWVFAAWTGGLTVKPELYRDTALHLAKLLERYFDETQALRRFQRFAYYFSANFRYGHTLFTRIRAAADLQRVIGVIERFFQTPPELSSRPNMNFFI